MKRIVAVFFAILLIFGAATWGICAPLNEQQKTEDFDYLYATLRDNYPFFWINERQNHVDWLRSRAFYAAQIKSAADDYQFYKTVEAILADLHNDHTGIIDGKFAALMRQVYGQYPSKKAWTETLSYPDVDAKQKYWADVLAANNDEAKMKASKKKILEAAVPQSEVSCRIIEPGNIAYLKIASFNPQVVEADGAKILEFLRTASNCKNLIIDIQGNDGGNSTTWEKYIVAPLTAGRTYSKSIYAFRGGGLEKKFADFAAQNMQPISQLPDKPHYPPELRKHFKEFCLEFDTYIEPENTVGFKGDKYLLVDGANFSAAEHFATFCKDTGFATLVGSRTGGDGRLFDPALIVLPNSGLIIRLSLEMGLNHDGSANEETHTLPDYAVDTSNPDAALNKALELIRK